MGDTEKICRGDRGHHRKGFRWWLKKWHKRRQRQEAKRKLEDAKPDRAHKGWSL